MLYLVALSFNAGQVCLFALLQSQCFLLLLMVASARPAHLFSHFVVSLVDLVELELLKRLILVSLALKSFIVFFAFSKSHPILIGPKLGGV